MTEGWRGQKIEMKKILLICFIAAAAISSCRKDDKSVFDKSPDERLKEKLDAYQAQLSGAQNGWKGLLRVDSGRGATFSFYFKFNNENRVVMLSDFDSLSAVTPKESSYRLKALQQPSLIFDTYSYLHVLADPDETVNGGVRGAGLLSDFEFYFDSNNADTIKLVGRFNGSKMTLMRATKPEEDAYTAGQLAAGLNINKILTYFKRLTVGTQLYDVKIDPLSRQFIFSWLDGSGNLQTFSTGYYFTLGAIVFTTPFVNGSQTISGFSNISWDPATETITLSASGTTATINGIVVPLKVDVAAPKRWWDYAINNDSLYWFSVKGFHVNGVDDAFGVQSLTSGTSTYFFLVYWPLFGANNDLFAPIFLNAAGTALTLAYGTAPAIPTFTADGRAIFVQLGNYGSYPNTGPAGQSRSLLYNSSGYYFVQTSATTYDMVSASNGKSWITWEF
jgi:hypothetical protein